MAYADYTFYSTYYFGTAIAETEFPRLALRASAIIDEITFGRAETETDANKIIKIKQATCAVAEELQKQDLTDGADGITSESQGQYSVSFGANSSRAQSSKTRLKKAARVWLANTFLMYAGFHTNEYGE